MINLKNNYAQASVQKIVVLAIVVLVVVLVIVFIFKFNFLAKFANLLPDEWGFGDNSEKENPVISFSDLNKDSDFEFGGGKTKGEGSERPYDKLEQYERYSGFIPEPVNWVSDYMEVISAKNEFELNKIISEIERETSVEIAIVSFSSDENDDSFKEIAFSLFNKWGIGKKIKNNGILIFFSVENNYVRIQIGQGMITGVLTDGCIGNLIDENLVGNLNKNKVESALLSTVQDIKDILDKEYLGE